MHTIEGVEICTAGMEWHASTGVHAVTLEHIADAVRAANEDPHIQVPRGKLGHYSDVNTGLPMWDPFAAVSDAAPAFGRFINLRTSNDGAVLIGDAVDVPDWINASSYPSRSMESVPDVVTQGGKRYSMVVTAVAWLGEPLPAISDVADLQTLLEQGPDALAASREEPDVPQPTAASVSTSLIRERFNWEWTSSDPVDGVDTYWWWARDVRVDPEEVIADDDEGNLWSVSYSTDGADVVTFGTPVRVREDYVPVAAAAASVQATAPASQRVLATFSRPVKKDRPAAASAGPNTEEITMDEPVRQILVGQGLDPATATEDQVNAASVLVAAKALTPDPATPPAPADTEPVVAPVAVVEPPADVPDPVAVAATAQITSLSAEVAELRKKDHERELAATVARRDALADSAVKDGRITVAERNDTYRPLLDIDEKRIADQLAAMTPGRVPVTGQIGTAASAETGGITTTGWFPQLKED